MTGLSGGLGGITTGDKLSSESSTGGDGLVGWDFLLSYSSTHFA